MNQIFLILSSFALSLSLSLLLPLSVAHIPCLILIEALSENERKSLVALFYYYRFVPACADTVSSDDFSFICNCGFIFKQRTQYEIYIIA